MELFKTSLKDADAVLAIDNTCAKAWERRGLVLTPDGPLHLDVVAGSIG